MKLMVRWTGSSSLQHCHFVQQTFNIKRIFYTYQYWLFGYMSKRMLLYILSMCEASNGLKYEYKSLYSWMSQMINSHVRVIESSLLGWILFSIFVFLIEWTTSNIVHHVKYLYSVISQWKFNFVERRKRRENQFGKCMNNRVTSVSFIFWPYSIFCLECQTFSKV